VFDAGAVKDSQDRRSNYSGRVITLKLVAGGFEFTFQATGDRPANVRRFSPKGAACARLHALAFHRALVALAIDRDVALACEIFHEVERDTERIVQPKRVVAGHHAAGCCGPVERVFEAR